MVAIPCRFKSCPGHVDLQGLTANACESFFVAPMQARRPKLDKSNLSVEIVDGPNTKMWQPSPGVESRDVIIWSLCHRFSQLIRRKLSTSVNPPILGKRSPPVGEKSDGTTAEPPPFSETVSSSLPGTAGHRPPASHRPAESQPIRDAISSRQHQARSFHRDHHRLPNCVIEYRNVVACPVQRPQVVIVNIVAFDDDVRGSSWARHHIIQVEAADCHGIMISRRKGMPRDRFSQGSVES